MKRFATTKGKRLIIIVCLNIETISLFYNFEEESG
jgi:hypothetical protein